MFQYTDLSALACQSRAGECVAWRCSPDPTGTQETHAPSWESTRGHLELPLAPPCDASTHRARCGEGVGPVGPAGGTNGQRDSDVSERSDNCWSNLTAVNGRGGYKKVRRVSPLLSIHRHVQHSFPGKQAEQFEDLQLPGDQPFLVGLWESLTHRKRQVGGGGVFDFQRAQTVKNENCDYYSSQG